MLSSRISEFGTQVKLINRLLEEVLGWDVQGKKRFDEVTYEKNINERRVDYAFNLGGITELVLEAKSFDTDLNDPKYWEQAFTYGYNQGVSHAILTNFKRIIIFNTEIEEDELEKLKVLDMDIEQYLSNLGFDRLWDLSRSSVQNDMLSKRDELINKKVKRVPIGEQLSKDMYVWRSILIHDLKDTLKISKEDLELIVQKILNRLVFIRICEDRKYKNKLDMKYPNLILRHALHVSSDNKRTNILSKIFKDFHRVYDSCIFDSEYYSKVEISWNILKQVVDGLDHSSQSIKYNFAEIPVDVLGEMYEQYLSSIIGEKRSEGIYYTKREIVNRIMSDSLVEFLINTKPRNLKILDPACGSGSFLIKSLDLVKQAKVGSKNIGHNKLLSIVLKHIYGIDRDPQAVEISKLNIALKLLKDSTSIPKLDSNIINGNSVVDTKKIDKKYVNWSLDFKDIGGKFDAIVGNPPWISMKGKESEHKFSQKEIDYYIERYEIDSNRPNMYEVFIRKCLLELLKKNGIFSFIVPDRFCYNEGLKPLREIILKNYCLKKLYFRMPFEGVTADTVIFVIENKKPGKNNIIEIAEYPSNKFHKISQKEYEDDDLKCFFYTEDWFYKIIKRLKKSSKIRNLKSFDEELIVAQGFAAAKGTISSKRKQRYNEIAKGENLSNGVIKGQFYFNLIKTNIVGGTCDKTKLMKKNKIFIKKTGRDFNIAYSDKCILPEQSTYFIYSKNESNKSIEKIKYLSLILSARFYRVYYYLHAITNKYSQPQLKKLDLDKFLIPEPTDEELKRAIALWDKFFDAKKNLVRNPSNSLIKRRVKNLRTKMDEMVTNLLDLKKQEIKTIKNFDNYFNDYLEK